MVPQQQQQQAPWTEMMVETSQLTVLYRFTHTRHHVADSSIQTSPNTISSFISGSCNIYLSTMVPAQVHLQSDNTRQFSELQYQTTKYTVFQSHFITSTTRQTLMPQWQHGFVHHLDSLP